MTVGRTHMNANMIAEHVVEFETLSQECSGIFKQTPVVSICDCKVLHRRMLHQTFGGVSASGASGRTAISKNIIPPPVAQISFCGVFLSPFWEF